MHRSRTEQHKYDRHLVEERKAHKDSDNECTFCAIQKCDPQFISKTKYFKLIRNIFPYAVWDQQRVVNHLLIAPLAHVDSLASLSPEARLEFVQLISQYESEGYHVYARGAQAAARSIQHQHTHLIKCAGPSTNIVFFLRKPYVNIHI